MTSAIKSFEEELPAKIKADPDTAKEIGGVFVFKITGDQGGTWTLNLNELEIKKGETEGADCVIECSHETWEELSDDPSQAMPLFMAQKISASNPMLAIRLPDILE